MIGISRRLSDVGEQVLSAGGDMSEDMDPRLFTECLREVSSVSALWLLVQRFAKAQDFRTVTYHSIDVQSLGDSSFGAVAIGIPAEFHRMYTEEHLYLDDPFPPFAASQITPFFWRDLPQLTTLTEKQKAYLNRAREFGFADGLVCQVFGPQARNALVSIGFHHDRPRPTDAEVLASLPICGFARLWQALLHPIGACPRASWNCCVGSRAARATPRSRRSWGCRDTRSIRSCGVCLANWM